MLRTSDLKSNNKRFFTILTAVLDSPHSTQKFNALYKISTHPSVKKQEKNKKSTATDHESLRPTTVLSLEMFKIAPKTAAFVKKQDRNLDTHCIKISVLIWSR